MEAKVAQRAVQVVIGSQPGGKRAVSGDYRGSRNEDLEEDLVLSWCFHTPFSPTRGAAD